MANRQKSFFDQDKKVYSMTTSTSLSINRLGRLALSGGETESLIASLAAPNRP